MLRFGGTWESRTSFPEPSTSSSTSSSISFTSAKPEPPARAPGADVAGWLRARLEAGDLDLGPDKNARGEPQTEWGWNNDEEVLEPVGAAAIGDEGAALLAALLRRPALAGRLRALDLAGNGLTAAGCADLAAALRDAAAEVKMAGGAGVEVLRLGWSVLAELPPVLAACTGLRELDLRHRDSISYVELARIQQISRAN